MTDALKPCPFCGSTDLYATSNGHESHSVGCNFCGIEGPAAPTDSTARDVWNDRAALAQPSVEPVAHVSECEACFTPDACQLRGTCDHYAAEKLRIAAAPHPAPARVPLTDEQIMDIVDKERARVLMNEARVAYRVARAIEAAHGIKENNSGQS